MEFKTIYLIILAIFFLGIVIYDLYTRNNRIEGLLQLQNLNIEAAIAILNNRKQINNQNGHTDETILFMINKLASYGDEKKNKDVSDIMNSTDKPSIKVDKLSEIFDVPTYDPLNDNLVIYYIFKDIDNNVDEPNQFVIQNKSPNQYNGQSQSIFDANIILGKTNQTEIETILESTESIINGNHLNLLGGNGQLATSKNGAYLLWSNSPTFYDSNSFLGLSISVWFKSNTSTGKNSRILELTDGPGLGYIIINNNNENSGTMSFMILTTSGVKSINLPNINVVKNQWIHLVWTVSPSNGEWKIYINNECLCENDIYGMPTNANRNICYIGKSSFDSDGLYNGKIADFRIYQRAISAEDVNTLYNKGSSTQVRKSVNLIKNGSFAYPKLEGNFALVVNMKNWSAGRPVLVTNAPLNGYCNSSGMDPTLGYATQVALLSTGSAHEKNTTYGKLIQPDIKVIPKTKYEFSFLYSLYEDSTHKTNVKLSVNLGCYINTNIGTDPPIIPEPATWKIYTKQFDTDPDCTEEKLTIELISPKERDVDTTCAITCVSLRKI